MVPENLVRLAGAVVGAVAAPAAAIDGGMRIVVANPAFGTLVGDGGNLSGRELARLQACRWDGPDFSDAVRRVLPEERAFNGCPLECLDGRRMTVNGCPIRPDEHSASMMLLTFDTVQAPLPGSPAAITAGLTDPRVIEIAHRVKNLLALVQSLAIQTRGEDVASFRTAFLSRMKALALAHGTMLETSLDRAPLRSLLHNLLAPFLQDSPDRIVMDGPPVALSPNQVTIFALIVHELASNAARHGALSNSGGRILVTWRNDGDRLHLEWREQGAQLPPGTREAGLQDHEGFGTILIRRAVAYQLRGHADLGFAPDGFVCAMDFPLKRAA
ncbi:sensor histidine kinase [Marinibaculum pumilum]|uniref:histidine kinase n=1 Tax=Marinibaculum pumilum TaxID=1766165 RepID=A0ABV7L7Y7_9PROT